jgi:hypothetical protein
MNANFELYGWSGGFLEFVHQPNSTTIVPWYSADGMHWHAANALDPTGMEPQYGPEYAPRVTSLAEGPAGLVAAAELEPLGVACGPSEYPVQSLWRSADGGATWARIDLAGAFPQGSVYRISGGSGGYIARGSIDSRTAIWVSADGRSWRQSDLSVATFTNAGMSASISAAISFSGGFVLAGTTLRENGGCAGLDTSIKFIGALWRSADGTAWTRDDLKGGTAGDWTSMSVQRISDHALYATESSGNGTGDNSTETDTAWTSADGENWTVVSGGPPIIRSQLLSNGQRGMVVTGLDGNVPMPLAVWSFDNNLKPVKLSQHGDTPTKEPWFLGALGPAGLLVTSSDGARFWLGVPMAQ